MSRSRPVGSAAGPFCAAIGAGLLTVPTVRRMKREYAADHTFGPSAVVLLYASYTATISALVWSARRRVVPLPLPRRTGVAIGATLISAGAVAAATGAGRFGSGAQISGTRPGTLVLTGPYRRTRNPQYLGIVAMMSGLALASRSGLAGVVAAGATIALDRWIPSEELHLAQTFGEPYRRYCDSVPRWI